MPWTDDKRGGLHGPTVWRVLIVVGLVFAAVSLGLNAVGFRSNRSAIDSARSAIDSTRDLSCRIGAFFVGQPIVRQPGQTQQDFEETVHKAESFLRALKAQDCTDVKGASISTRQITRQLHHLHAVVPKGGGHGGSGNGGGKPGPPSGGPPPTPKPHCTVEVNALGQHVCVEAP